MKADDPEGPGRNPEADAARVLNLARRRGLITDDQADSTIAEVRERLMAAGLYDRPNRLPQEDTSIRVVIPPDMLDDDTLADLARELGLDDDRMPEASVDGEAEPRDPFDVFPVSNWERYEMVEFVGRGGMGDVFKARDPRLGRYVALKFLRRDDPDQVKRFVREAQVQARVEHENLCPVYEVGDVEGHSYIAMQYISGGSIKDIADLLSSLEKVEIMVDVADALHAAHQAGLIHRDVKPANILVERTPGGRWHPFVVDFGIARDIDTPHDLTVSGMVLGTPAFSAPEQVRGESSKLDRRTDVYGLGATLYWFLTGRSPYEGAYTEIISGVAERDPVPPHRIDRTIPVDLETIVLKCLEKEQDRRYPTAREMSEDLRRFLAGEPITARPATMFYKLGKRVRKHPRLVTAGVATIAAFIALGLISLRTNLHTRRQAAVAQLLTERAREIESFARVAAMMPLHDRTQERHAIERRMAAIENEMARLGDISSGPGHYALGRGWLTLHDDVAARNHLEQALKMDYSRPGVSYALGLALGRSYQRELTIARRIESDELRDARIAEIDRDFRDPALALLRSGGESTVEAPQYAEALISFYGGHLEEALTATRAAFQTEEWLYEAKLLEADILVEMAASMRLKGEPDKALETLAEADQAYHLAADIARSDPSVYEGDCGLWTEIMDIRSRRGESVVEPFDRAVEACDRALRIDPERAEVHERLSHLYWRWADIVNDRGGSAEPFLRQAVASADRAISLDPESVPAFVTRGGALTVSALDEMARGEDPRETLAQAIASYESAIAIDPGFVPAHDDLGYAWERMARYQMGIGLDPRPALDRAVSAFRRAIDLNPNYANAYNNSGIALWRRSMFELRTASDPGPALDEAVSAFDAAIVRNPSYAYAYANRGLARRTMAMVRLDDGRDPSEPLDLARSDLDTALALNPQIFWAYPEKSAVEILAARWAIHSGASPQPYLEAASLASSQALTVNPRNAVAFQGAAEVSRWRAEDRLRRGLSIRSDISEGRHLVEQALSLNPGLASAMVTGAALTIIQAEAEDAGSTRTALAAQAEDAVRRALEINPYLERETADLRRRIADVSN
jgi:tetratricopeptide (TPR) repeat protein/tRNA A-37 threonylcarbamoyl transferase component Bud32